ncbi:Hypothetical predicted protein [Mytilus galloprovincialis]|uniref:Uncharacterized protein n=1 Tax=Mytilus galloprovincialis TaxID=29158 RepID=A0A8B6HMF0_MYTGA|nr:Hypothetical predicted protein [Mytilus galloprovincialis]
MHLMLRLLVEKIALTVILMVFLIRTHSTNGNINQKMAKIFDGLNNGTLILQDFRMQYQISGTYVCTVSNGIPDVNDSISQTGFTYFSYQGAPIFPNDETLIMYFDLYQPMMVTFSIYSNPTIEKIWIEGVALDYTINETIHCFKISETKLKYTEFKSNAYMKGKEIVFEVKMFSHEYEMYKLWAENGLGKSSTTFKIRTVGKIILNFSYNIVGQYLYLRTEMLRSNDLHVYNIEANNSLGFDSYQFEIISADFDENNAKPNERFITSSSVAACLLIYIIVMHIYMCVRHRTKRTRRGSIPQSLHFNTYDEIELLSYELVNVRGVSSDQQEQIMQTSVIRNLQDESYITHYNNQLPIDGHTDSSAQSSVQESQFYEHGGVQQHNTSGGEVEVSSVLSFDSIESCGEEATEHTKLQPNNTSEEVFEASSFGDIVRTVEIYDEEAAVLASDSLQSSQSSGHQDDNLSSSVYENSYQPVNRERQDTHQYSVLLNLSEEVDSDRSASTVKLSRNVPDYVNLQF